MGQKVSKGKEREADPTVRSGCAAWNTGSTQLRDLGRLPPGSCLSAESADVCKCSARGYSASLFTANLAFSPQKHQTPSGTQPVWLKV